MSETPLRLLIIGAHPDDADYHAGGTAALYRAGGHAVKMVSLTNGDAGHQSMHGPPLAQRRRAEAAAAGAVIGASYETWDNPDGELLPSLEVRRRVIGLIRSYRPDLVLTHRPNDYHPDHRYTSTVVQDAAFMVTVPAIVPEVPHLARNPVIAYLPDSFQKPSPFHADVVVDVTGVVGKIADMLHCHQSQFYEWLPYNGGYLEQVPSGNAERRAWLLRQVQQRLREQANRFREAVLQAHGRERGAMIEYVEAFEACEYGAPLDDANKERLFGVLMNSARHNK